MIMRLQQENEDLQKQKAVTPVPEATEVQYKGNKMMDAVPGYMKALLVSAQEDTQSDMIMRLRKENEYLKKQNRSLRQQLSQFRKEY